MNHVEDNTQKQLQEKVDNIQQGTKINELRQISFKELCEEQLTNNVVNLFNEKVKMNDHNIISVDRIEKTKKKTRHAVMKFSDNACKMKIFNNTKLWKGTGFVSKEDLIQSRLQMVQITASDKYVFKNLWAVNGIIFAKNTQRHTKNSELVKTNYYSNCAVFTVT